MTVKITPVVVSEKRNLGTHLAEKWLGYRNTANTDKLVVSEVLHQLQAMEPKAPPPRRPASNEILSEVFSPDAIAPEGPGVVPVDWTP